MDNESRIKKFFPALAANSALLSFLSAHTTVQTLNKGTVLLREDAYVKFVPLVISGLVKVYKEDENGSEVLLYYIKPGETCIVSVISVEKNNPAMVKGVVEEDATILLIPAQKLYDLRKNYPEWNLFIYNAFNEKFEEVVDMVRVLTFSNKEKRLLDYLNQLALVTGKNTLNKSHNEIANELGSSREVISRLLKKLEKEGRIKLGLKKIELLNV